MTNSTELEFGIVQLIKLKDKENGSVARESDGLENQNPTMCQDMETSNHWHKQIWGQVSEIIEVVNGEKISTKGSSRGMV